MKCCSGQKYQFSGLNRNVTSASQIIFSQLKIYDCVLKHLANTYLVLDINKYIIFNKLFFPQLLFLNLTFLV